MKYFSTRSTARPAVSFSDVLLAGLAPDGGLYVPDGYPELSKHALRDMSELAYADLAYACLLPYVGDDFCKEALKQIVEATYCQEVFPDQAVTPVESLYGSLYLQDLSQGPSLAFKDLALQFLGRSMDYLLGKADQCLTILGASSGDTVSAAEQALRSKSRIKVVMLTPKTGMSSFQRAQAGSILDENIFNVSIGGPFDLCQDLVKALNRDAAFKKEMFLGAVNSINWGRIVAQLVYYFKGYFSVVKTVGDPCDVVVPSGNFGNILAGYIAKRMGLPLRRLIVATNENTVLDRFFKEGVYQKTDVQVTSSPSMDISKASNLERFFFDLAGRDAGILAGWMEAFEGSDHVDLGDSLRDKARDYGFYSGTSTHCERQRVIKAIYERCGRIIDPHTAAAIKVAQDYREDDVPMICMETAKPCKFEDAVEEALGFLPDRPAGFEGIEDAEQRFYDVEASEDALKTFIKKIIV
ncbi:MAG: threonine synthase [bacterium]